MSHSKDVLLCWHAKRAGFEVLIQAIKSLKEKNILIGKVFYLIQQGSEPEFEDVRGVEVQVVPVRLRGPTQHAEIYAQIKERVIPLLDTVEGTIHINVSPGTPAMHAVWLVLHAGSAFPKATRLWSSQRNHDDNRTWIEAVEFEVSTYLSEIRQTQRNNSPQAAYDPEAKSIARRDALTKLKRYAAVQGAPLLILGERGTGKTRLVESFVPHLKQRTDVVSLACGGLDSSLAESLLFGHAKGAFTGAAKERRGLLDQANGGVLFLDEVQDLPSGVQRKLVRVFQDRQRRFRRIGDDSERSVDVELVCASNLPLDKLRERLDDDLFDRLSHLAVRIPPLRECREDLRQDWSNVWTENGHLSEVKEPWSPTMSDVLRTHALPGNLRDLQRLAVLITAWIPGNKPEKAIDEAMKEWATWGRSDRSKAQQLFGSGTRSQRIDWFKSELAQWAHKEHQTWESAAQFLGCNEGTLRKDVIKPLANSDS